MPTFFLIVTQMQVEGNTHRTDLNERFEGSRKKAEQRAGELTSELRNKAELGDFWRVAVETQGIAQTMRDFWEWPVNQSEEVA